MKTPAQTFEDLVLTLVQRQLLAATVPDAFTCMAHAPSDQAPWSLTLAIHAEPLTLVLTAQLPIPGPPGTELATGTVRCVNELNRLQMPACFFADPMGTLAGFRLWLPLAHCRASLAQLVDHALESFATIAAIVTPTLCPGLAAYGQPTVSDADGTASATAPAAPPPQWAWRYPPPDEPFSASDIPF